MSRQRRTVRETVVPREVVVSEWKVGSGTHKIHMSDEQKDTFLDELVRLQVEKQEDAQRIRELEALVGDLQGQLADLLDAKKLRGWINPIYAELD